MHPTYVTDSVYIEPKFRGRVLAPAVLLRPPQHLQVPPRSGGFTRPLIPRAIVLKPRPLQHLQAPGLGVERQDMI
jgi:hypothetical protein